ncbi:MAG: hypothetical protein ACYCQI_08730 [Gammaproteobacteria bacterium]
MKKLLTILMTGLVASNMAFAKDAATRSQNLNAKEMGIHSLKITNTNYFWTRTFYPTLHMGNWVNGVCATSTNEPMPQFDLAGNTYTYYNIWGDVLTQKYGLNFNCAQLTVESSAGQYAVDTFSIYHNGFIYSATRPEYAETFFNAV